MSHVALEEKSMHLDARTSLIHLPEASAGSAGKRLAEVPVEMLAPNPRNARHRPDDLEDLTTIVDAQVQPATAVSREAWLQLYPDDDSLVGDAEYVVVNGCRRLAAARRFGRPSLDVVIHDTVAEDDQTVITTMLLENLARTDLDPIEEAKGVQMLVNTAPSAAAVARLLGKSPSWVSKRLKLLNLTPELQDETRAGRLLLERAWELGHFPKGEQVAEWMATHDNEDEPAPEPTAEPEPQPDPSEDEPDSETSGPVQRIVRALRTAKADPETAVAALEEHFDPTELAQISAMLTGPRKM